MQRVVVTVKRKNEARVRDIEVPADIEVERLATLIAHALHWDSDPAGEPLQYGIEAHPLGRVLKPHESLVSAGVWDGAWLVLYPVEPAVPVVEMPAPPAETYAVETYAPAEIMPQQLVAAETVQPAPFQAEVVPQQEVVARAVEAPYHATEPEFAQPTPVQSQQRVPVEQIASPADATEATEATEATGTEEQYDLEALLAGTYTSASAPSSPTMPTTAPTQVEPPQPELTPEYTYPAPPAFESRPGSQLVAGWRGLGINLPIESSDEDTDDDERPSSGGFVWKQLSD